MIFEKGFRVVDNLSITELYESTVQLKYCEVVTKCNRLD